MRQFGNSGVGARGDAASARFAPGWRWERDAREWCGQLFTESILLAAVSGAAALALSSMALKVIELRSDGGTVPIGTPGWLAIGATAVLAMIAAMVFGSSLCGWCA